MRDWCAAAAAAYLVVWRIEHFDVIRDVARVIRCALGGADVQPNEAAKVVGMDPALWSRYSNRGGNLAALIVMAKQNPTFKRELRGRLDELLADDREIACRSVPPVERAG